MRTTIIATQTSDAGDSPADATLQSSLAATGLPGAAPAPRNLPDPAICQARPAGFPGYVECLVPPPFQCQHVLRFGYGFFCQHPQRHEIAMRTATQGQKPPWR
jgi:hypothetical protein